jgi:Tfp pilus assembly protein PilX
MKNRVRDEKGIILIVALLLLLALTIIGISSINTTSFESVISGNERLSNAAFYASEAGVQLGMNQVPETTPVSKTTIGADSSYEVTVSSAGLGQTIGDDQNWVTKRYRVNSTGNSLGASKEIEVMVRFGPIPRGTEY